MKIIFPLVIYNNLLKFIRMTTKRTFYVAATICILALTVTSCNFVKESAPIADEMIGSNPEELQEKITEVLKFADTDLEKAQFAEISSGYHQVGNIDPTISVTLDIVNPKDQNKLLRVSWDDKKSTRNYYSKEDLVLSDSKNNIINKYEDFKDMLFSYSDAKIYIDNVPTYCKEALEASGYKDAGFIDRLTIERRPYEGNQVVAMIRVGYKKNITLVKSYTVSKDGLHIEKK